MVASSKDSTADALKEATKPHQKTDPKNIPGKVRWNTEIKRDLALRGKLNAKKPMPPEQKKLGRRKRKK